MVRGFLALTVALTLASAGCLMGGQRKETGLVPVDDVGKELVGGLSPGLVSTASGPLEFRVGAGAISSFRLNASGDAEVEIPANVFRFDPAAKRFDAQRRFTAKAGSEFQLLLPPGMTELRLTLDGVSVVLAVPDTGHHLFQGQNIVAWYKIQRDQYPQRCAGCPSYAKSQQYFADLFRSFGYPVVEIDPYGQNQLHSEFANVVAYRYAKTDVMHPQWLGVGGHYDVVRGTVEGAFDNTAGTLATLELARVMANVSTRHNLVFGLWGGEESGLQGSAFFTRTHPNIAAQMRLYVNLDASAFSWPAPQPVAQDGTVPDCAKRPVHSASAPYFCPDPVLVSAGPDGPVATALLGLGKTIQQEVAVGYPSEYFVYEPIVVGGQFGGYAGVNAQSDHTSFIAAGVPSWFLINADIFRTPIGIHNRADTVENWTHYMVHNYPADFEVELTVEERELAERYMARSFETYLWLTFYAWLYHDLGLFSLATSGIPAQ